MLTDTREQAPLVFPTDPVVTKVRTETLPVGDYMVEFADGTRPPVAWERKGLGDLYQTMGQGYDRFKAELLRAQQAQITLILLLESTLTEVAQGHAYSRIEGTSMVQKLFTLMARYRLPVVFCDGRREAARYLLEQAKAIGREYVAARQRGTVPVGEGLGVQREGEGEGR